VHILSCKKVELGPSPDSGTEVQAAHDSRFDCVPTLAGCFHAICIHAHVFILFTPPIRCTLNVPTEWKSGISRHGIDALVEPSQLLGSAASVALQNVGEK
jgi:hypothetical protein